MNAYSGTVMPREKPTSEATNTEPMPTLETAPEEVRREVERELDEFEEEYYQALAKAFGLKD